MWDEAQSSLDTEYRDADREREYQRQELMHDAHEPTTFERTDEPLLKKLMGDDFDKYFGEDEKQHKYYWDAKYGF